MVYVQYLLLSSKKFRQKDTLNHDVFVLSIANELWNILETYYSVNSDKIPDFILDEVKRHLKNFSVPKTVERKKKSNISHYQLNHEWMEDRSEVGRQKDPLYFVISLSRREQDFIPMFKQAIISNYYRDKDLVFKRISKVKASRYNSMIEYTEVTYNNLREIINFCYLSDNIGTYYLNLLKNR